MIYDIIGLNVVILIFENDYMNDICLWMTFKRNTLDCFQQFETEISEASSTTRARSLSLRRCEKRWTFSRWNYPKTRALSTPRSQLFQLHLSASLTGEGWFRHWTSPGTQEMGKAHVSALPNHFRRNLLGPGGGVACGAQVVRNLFLGSLGRGGQSGTQPLGDDTFDTFVSQKFVAGDFSFGCWRDEHFSPNKKHCEAVGLPSGERFRSGVDWAMLVAVGCGAQLDRTAAKKWLGTGLGDLHVRPTWLQDRDKSGRISLKESRELSVLPNSLGFSVFESTSNIFKPAWIGIIPSVSSIGSGTCLEL